MVRMQQLLHVGRNHKIDKNDKEGVYRTAHLNLAPSDTSGVINVCPKASEGCKAVCLYTAGWGATPRVQNARVRDTILWHTDRKLFLDRLTMELDRHDRYCGARGLTPVVRLNMTSDILWERHGIPQNFPHIQFYDYTKIPRRKVPDNYHLTFSLDENNMITALDEMSEGRNVCVVFREKDWYKYRKEMWGYNLINGDENDLRFLDPPHSVIGVKAKGRAVYDKTGFVVDADPKFRFNKHIFSSLRYKEYLKKLSKPLHRANTSPQG